jgi:hypothetical protein
MTFYYYSTEYPNEKQDMDEFFEYDTHLYEPYHHDLPIDTMTTDIARELYQEHDGWDWWHNGDQIKIHIWDNTRKYLGYFMAEYEVEPSFYTGNMVKP